MKNRARKDQQVPNRVLLVCIYDTLVLDITNEVVFARYCSYGPIIKILIFEKGEVTKFFIEFAFIEHAVQAKSALDGARLFESLCKMNIYYSNFASVDLKHQTTEGISLQSFVPQYINYADQASQFPIYDSYNSSYCRYYNMLPPSVSTTPLNHSSSQQYIPFIKTPYRSQQMSETGEDDVDINIECDIDWLLRSQEKQTRRDETGQDKQNVPINQQCSYLQFASTIDLTNMQVYNLFSNFGNISLIKKTKKMLYLKFRSEESALLAKNYLQGYWLRGNVLDLSFVKDQNEVKPREGQFAEITYFDTSYDRFTSQKSIVINPPGRTLHVFALNRQSCRLDNLRYIFEEFGAVETVQILNYNADNCAAMIKFERVEDSLDAMSMMHNKTISGKKIQISFTKGKTS